MVCQYSAICGVFISSCVSGIQQYAGYLASHAEYLSLPASAYLAFFLPSLLRLSGKFFSTGGFAGGLNGRRSQTGVMPKILVAAMGVVKDGGQI